LSGYARDSHLITSKNQAKNSGRPSKSWRAGRERSGNLAYFGLRHSQINKPVPDQRRLNDRRRQPITHLVHLRRDGGAEIVITAERKVRHPVFKGRQWLWRRIERTL
jgi:hypothetical protein